MLFTSFKIFLINSVNRLLHDDKIKLPLFRYHHRHRLLFVPMIIHLSKQLVYFTHSLADWLTHKQKISKLTFSLDSSENNRFSYFIHTETHFFSPTTIDTDLKTSFFFLFCFCHLTTTTGWAVALFCFLQHIRPFIHGFFLLLLKFRLCVCFIPLFSPMFAQCLSLFQVLRFLFHTMHSALPRNYFTLPLHGFLIFRHSTI